MFKLSIRVPEPIKLLKQWVDGKHQNPQIVLGLLVSKDGYPLTYEIFKGSQFEGKTMLPIIKSFQEKQHLKKPIIVADAGLLSKENIIHLNNIVPS